MIGLDTNVIVRFLAQDDREQAAIATRVFADLSPREPGFVSSIVLAEVSWVLATSYRVSREVHGEAIERLLRSTELIIENPEAAYRALALFRSGTSVQFADALIATTGALAGAAETVTFDRLAAREAGMRLLTSGSGEEPS